MIGMNLVSFLTLLVISVVVSFVLHYLVKYRLAQGVEGFFGKLIVGWLGGWLGSPVLGYWPDSVKLGSIYLVPALLGSLAAVFGVVLLLKITECKHPAGK
jgi:uncharacterized membrane protein YeaQ/YmgE (transglycosylase-associated protein family)